MSGIDFGVVLRQQKIEFSEIRDAAELCDELGYHSVWFYDHLLGQGGLVRALEGRMDGRKMALLGFALLPLPMYLMAYTAPSVGLSLVCLFPIAIGSSLIQPALAGLTSLNAAEDRQGLALGVLRSTGSLGRAIGPLGGAYLYWFLGIHDTYLVIAILLLLVVLLALSAPDPTRPPREEAP